MDEQNFDKFFGDHLKADEDFPFSDDKWDKMKNHLNTHIEAKRRRRLGAWLSIPLLALLGSLGFMGWSLHNSQQDIRSLTAEIKTLHLEKEASVSPSVSTVKSDTVYHHVVVRRYDTIFQTVVRRDFSDGTTIKSDVSPSKTKIIGENKVPKKTTTITDVPKNSSSQMPNSVSKNEMGKGNEGLKTDFTQKEEEKKVLGTTPASNDTILSANKKRLTETVNNDAISQKSPLNNTSENKNANDSSKTTITQSDSLQINTNTPINKETTDSKFEVQDPLSKKEEKAEKGSEIDEPVLEKQVKKRPPIIKLIKMGGYEVGVSGGIAAIDGKDILHQNGFSTGIRGGILLGNHFKIVGEAQFLTLNYEVNKLTGERDIPVINPPTANDVFHEVRVEQLYWQYALGLQYVFGNKRLKPYIGTSLVGQSKMEEKFEYQFQNRVTREDVFVRTKRHDDSFQLPIMRLNVGAEYPIWRKIQAQIEGSYDVKVNNIPQFKPLWQLKAAVLYRF